MLCDEAREHLSAYVDRELTAEMSAAIRDHLASCAECRALVADLRQTADILCRLPVRPAPRHVAADVQREIERRLILQAPASAASGPAPDRTIPLRRIRHTSRAVAVAASILLAAGIGVLAYMNQPLTPTQIVPEVATVSSVHQEDSTPTTTGDGRLAANGLQPDASLVMDPATPPMAPAPAPAGEPSDSYKSVRDRGSTGSPVAEAEGRRSRVPDTTNVDKDILPDAVAAKDAGNLKKFNGSLTYASKTPAVPGDEDSTKWNLSFNDGKGQAHEKKVIPPGTSLVINPNGDNLKAFGSSYDTASLPTARSLALAKIDSGALSLSCTNSYSGVTTVAAGAAEQKKNIAKLGDDVASTLAIKDATGHGGDLEFNGFSQDAPDLEKCKPQSIAPHFGYRLDLSDSLALLDEATQKDAEARFYADNTHAKGAARPGKAGGAGGAAEKLDHLTAPSGTVSGAATDVAFTKSGAGSLATGTGALKIAPEPTRTAGTVSGSEFGGGGGGGVSPLAPVVTTPAAAPKPTLAVPAPPSEIPETAVAAVSSPKSGGGEKAGYDEAADRKQMEADRRTELLRETVLKLASNKEAGQRDLAALADYNLVLQAPSAAEGTAAISQMLAADGWKSVPLDEAAKTLHEREDLQSHQEEATTQTKAATSRGSYVQVSHDAAGATLVVVTDRANLSKLIEQLAGSHTVTVAPGSSVAFAPAVEAQTFARAKERVGGSPGGFVSKSDGGGRGGSITGNPPSVSLPAPTTPAAPTPTPPASTAEVVRGPVAAKNPATQKTASPAKPAEPATIDAPAKVMKQPFPDGEIAMRQSVGQQRAEAGTDQVLLVIHILTSPAEAREGNTAAPAASPSK